MSFIADLAEIVEKNENGLLAAHEAWQRVQLGEVATILNGYPFDSKYFSKSDGMPLIRIRDILRVSTDILYTGVIPSGYWISQGDTLVGMDGDFNIARWRGSPALLNQRVCKISGRTSFIDSAFLAYVLRGYLAAINLYTSSVTVKHLSSRTIAEIPLPYPPLNEQKRIADKLDALLAQVDACRERLDRVPGILKRFRQSALAAATSGRLTEDWRVETGAGQKAWESGELFDLLESKPRNGYSPRAVEYETPVKSLTLTATTSGRFRPEFFKYIDEGIPEESHLWLEPGDILIQRANTIENVGVSALYDGPKGGFIYPDLMMKARANRKVLPVFLHVLLLSDGVRRHFRENATGTAGNMPKINQQTVMAAPVAWPSLEEQQEIVRRVEILFAYADELEARVAAARAQVERLTPALLAKAFRGELVPQDPNDESAEVLLERLRAENAGQEKKRRGRKA